MMIKDKLFFNLLISNKNMSEQKKILLVEDDIFIRDIYQTKFAQEGYEVIFAENGLDGLKKLETFSPDIILLDMVMPYMGGIEMLNEIRKNESLNKTPVIMLTNISEQEKVNEAMDDGANDYIIKSHFTPSEVIEKIRTLLDK